MEEKQIKEDKQDKKESRKEYYSELLYEVESEHKSFEL